MKPSCKTASCAFLRGRGLLHVFLGMGIIQGSVNRRRAIPLRDAEALMTWQAVLGFKRSDTLIHSWTLGQPTLLLTLSLMC